MTVGQLRTRWLAAVARPVALLFAISLLGIGLGSAAPRASALDIGLMSGGGYWLEEGEWDVMHHAGATVFRGGISAAQYENPSQWAQIEQMFEWAAERNMVILPYLYGKPGSGSQRFPTKEEWEEPEWDEFVEAIVHRFGYGGSFWSENPSVPSRAVGAWEVWNEPNLPANNPLYEGEEKVQPQNYARFLVHTSEVIKEAQAEISESSPQVLFGGLYSKAGSKAMDVAEFLQKAKELENKESVPVGPSFKGLSLHPYSFAAGLSGVEGYVNEARTNLTNYFGTKSIWITELGWNVKPWESTGHEAVTEAQQAEYLTKSFNWIKSKASEKNIQLVTWYFYRDQSGSNWDHHTGLRNEAGGYRPAWTAFQEQTGATAWPDSNPYSWHSENLGGVATSDPDGLTAGIGHLEVFERGSDGGLWTRSYSHFKWNGWSKVASSVTGGPGSVWGGGQATVANRISNATVQSYWWNGSWSTFNLGGNNTSDPDLSAWGTSRMDMFVRGSDNALWHRPWNSGTWGSWEKIGGTLKGGPAAVSWGSERIDVVARAPNDTLQTWYYDGTWHTGPNLGGVNTSDPDIAATAPGHLVVAVRGSDNALWLRQYDSSSGWGGWEKVGGTLESGPTAVAWQSNYRLDIFAEEGGSLIHRWWGPGAP